MWSYRIVLLVCANLFSVVRSLSGDTTQDFFQNQSWSGSSSLHANFLRLLKNDGSLDIDLLAGLADSTYVDDSLSAKQNISGVVEEEDYKTPPWPKCKDEVCYSNVPHTLLVADKGGQNWITIKRIKFVFPKDMLPMTPCLFWNLVAREGYTSIWQKTTNDSSFGPSSSKLLPLDDKDPILVRFSSALMSENEEVPSVVLMAAFNTLPVIYDWKWTGVAHDWCKAFGAYPHLYDILHSLTSPYGAALWTFIWGEARSTSDQEQDNQFSMHSIKQAAKNDGPSNQQNFLLLLVTFGLMVIFMWEMFGPLVFICIIILGGLWYLFMTST